MSTGKWKRKKKPAQYSNVSSTATDNQLAYKQPGFPYTLKTKLILRMDKIMDGSFAGLYQLVSIKETGEEVVLTDANTLQYIIIQSHKAIMGAL